MKFTGAHALLVLFQYLGGRKLALGREGICLRKQILGLGFIIYLPTLSPLVFHINLENYVQVNLRHEFADTEELKFVAQICLTFLMNFLEVLKNSGVVSSRELNIP